VETELDLGNRSKWIMVERDPALCELHNEDVGIICGWPNFEIFFVSLCLSFRFTSDSCSSLLLLKV
jgi:hypothetical protein